MKSQDPKSKQGPFRIFCSVNLYCGPFRQSQISAVIPFENRRNPERSRKTATPKRRNGPKAVRGRSASAVSLQAKVARLTRERDEALKQLSQALKQQTAASEVLRLISGSPGELGAVFDAMLVNATRLCEARFGILLLWEGDAFRTVALHNAPPAFVEHRRREPVIRPAPVTSLGRLVATKQVDHVADMRAEKGYVDSHPGPVSLVELAGARTVINVPMLKEDELMTRSTSAVAVCCSSDCRSSLSSRVFSMAMTA